MIPDVIKYPSKTSTSTPYAVSTTKQIQEPAPLKKAIHTTRKISPGNYDAVEVNKSYGLIHIGKGAYNEDNFVLHTRVKDDKTPMLSIQMGDTIDIMNLQTKRKQTLTVRYTTRSRYYSPGVMINTMKVGVDGWSD